jgi:hypothetical protein
MAKKRSRGRRAFWLNSQRQQFLDLLQREAQLLCSFDEAEANLRRRVRTARSH